MGVIQQPLPMPDPSLMLHGKTLSLADVFWIQEQHRQTVMLHLTRADNVGKLIDGDWGAINQGWQDLYLKYMRKVLQLIK